MHGRVSLRFRAAARVIPARQRGEEARRQAYRDTSPETRREEESVLPLHPWQHTWEPRSRLGGDSRGDDCQNRAARNPEVRIHAAGHPGFLGLFGRGCGYRSYAYRYREIHRLAAKHISRGADFGRPDPAGARHDGVRLGGPSVHLGHDHRHGRSLGHRDRRHDQSVASNSE